MFKPGTYKKANTYLITYFVTFFDKVNFVFFTKHINRSFSIVTYV